MVGTFVALHRRRWDGRRAAGPGAMAVTAGAGVMVRALTLGVVLLVLASRPLLAGPPIPPEPPQRVVAAAAFGAVDAGDFPRARRIAARLDDPLARKALHWFVLVEQRRDTEYREYVDFITANPHWPWQFTLQDRAEGAMPPGLPDAQVRAFFAEREPITPYGTERYAAALIADGLSEAARALLRHAWLTRNFSAADERRFRRKYADVLDAALERQRLDRLIWERRLSAATRQARRVDGDYRALARARMLLARMAPGVDGAIARVPPKLRDHPGLVYERALWRQRKGRYEGVVELLDPPRPKAPYPRLWWPVRHWTARMALDRGEVALAYRIAVNHGLERGVGFAQGEWLAGWIALRFLDEPEIALMHFTRLHGGVMTPVSQARGAYWAGRAAEALGRKAEARRWYEAAAANTSTFYGQLAAAESTRRVVLTMPRPTRPGPARRAAFERRELVRVVRAMGKLGQDRRVDRFIRHLADEAHNAENARLVADLARDIGRRDLAVDVARMARREGVILTEHLYPVAPLPGIGDADRALVLAIVRQESGFDPAAVSHAGALGLMQLMPATARQVARRQDLAYSRARLTSDGAYNLRLGSSYIAELVARYEGSLLLAVAAYNAGPARVDAWLLEYGDPRAGFVDAVDWIESLPFAETRNYVQRVFEGLLIYRQRLAPSRVAMNLDADRMLHGGAAP